MTAENDQTMTALEFTKPPSVHCSTNGRISMGTIWVKLKTHSSGGITDRDFDLAREIDRVALWKPAPGSNLEGTTAKWVTAKTS